MKRLIALFGALVLGLMTAACAEGTGGGSDPAQEAEPAATNAVEVTLQDYAFAVEGEAAAGPLMVNFNNIGEETHHAIIGKLDEGKTLEDVQKVVEKGLEGPPPPWFDDSPADMTVLSPGQSAGIALDAEEGTYVLLCFMPDPEGKPHITHGMVQTFDVTAAEETAEIEADQELSMTEDGVEAPELSSGTSTITVTNDASMPGEFFVGQLAEGKTLEDIDPWFGKGQPDPAPITFFGGTHTFKPGESVTIAVDLEPGDYQIVSTYGQGKNRKDVPTDFTVSG